MITNPAELPNVTAGSDISTVKGAHTASGLFTISVFELKLLAFKKTPASHFWSDASAIAIFILYVVLGTTVYLAVKTVVIPSNCIVVEPLGLLM